MSRQSPGLSAITLLLATLLPLGSRALAAGPSASPAVSRSEPEPLKKLRRFLKEKHGSCSGQALGQIEKAEIESFQGEPDRLLLEFTDNFETLPETIRELASYPGVTFNFRVGTLIYEIHQESLGKEGMSHGCRQPSFKGDTAIGHVQLSLELASKKESPDIPVILGFLEGLGRVVTTHTKRMFDGGSPGLLRRVEIQENRKVYLQWMTADLARLRNGIEAMSSGQTAILADARIMVLSILPLGDLPTILCEFKGTAQDPQPSSNPQPERVFEILSSVEESVPRARFRGASFLACADASGRRIWPVDLQMSVLPDDLTLLDAAAKKIDPGAEVRYPVIKRDDGSTVMVTYKPSAPGSSESTDSTPPVVPTTADSAPPTSPQPVPSKESDPESEPPGNTPGPPDMFEDGVVMEPPSTIQDPQETGPRVKVSVSIPAACDW